MKLWAGSFHKELDPKTNDFNSSIAVDSRMFREDIEGQHCPCHHAGRMRRH